MQQGIQHYVKRQLFSIQNILKGVLTLILANVAIHSFALTTADNTVANDIKPVILKATKSVAHPAPPLDMAKPHLIQNRYLIEFDKPSFAEFETVQTNNRLNKTHKQAKQQTLLSKQEEHIKQLQKQLPSLRINQRFTQLFNGVEVELEKAHLKALKSLKHVKRVYPVKLRYLSLDASEQIIKAQAAWEAVGGQSKAGEGIKIAIVDTGIRNNNPMFNDEGITPLDLSGNTHLNDNPDYCRSETGSADFCNNKIVVARWVDPILFGLDIYEQEYMSPMDFDGHGTHVAGIAAGRALSVNFNNANADISGVAPASHLMIYKALYTSPFGGAYATDTMLLQALEWAVSDGAEVINNSWGAGSGEDPDSSVYQTVFNSAESLGIVVVNAAGNTGHPGATINCPACIESGIAVANSTHGRFFGHAIATSEGTVYGYPGQAEPLVEDVNLNAAALRLLESDNANGCAPITEAIPDSAAVVIAYPPFCPLSMSVQHASDAGA